MSDDDDISSEEEDASVQPPRPTRYNISCIHTFNDSHFNIVETFQIPTDFFFLDSLRSCSSVCDCVL